jgi:hypothetical protein
MEETNTNNQSEVLISPEIKPEDCLVEKTFGKYNVSIDKILELKAKDPKMGYRKIGAALGMNYKVIQRAYNSYLKTKNPNPSEKSLEQTAENSHPVHQYKDRTLGRDFVVGQMIISGYVTENLDYKKKE